MNTVDASACPEHEWLARALDWGVVVRDETKVGAGPDGFRVRAVAALPVDQMVYHRIELRDVRSGATSGWTLLNGYYPALDDQLCVRLVDALSTVHHEDHLALVTRDARGVATMRRPDCDMESAAAAVAASKCLYGWDESVPIKVALADSDVSWEVFIAHPYKWVVEDPRGPESGLTLGPLHAVVASLGTNQRLPSRNVSLNAAASSQQRANSACASSSLSASSTRKPENSRPVASARKP